MMEAREVFNECKRKETPAQVRAGVQGPNRETGVGGSGRGGSGAGIGDWGEPVT